MKYSLFAFAAGTAVGCVFVAALLLFDIGGLGTLLARDRADYLVLFMLLAQIGGVFGIAIAVSSPGGEEYPHGHRKRLALELKPALEVRRLRSPNK